MNKRFTFSVCFLLLVQVNGLWAQTPIDTRVQQGRFSPQFIFQSWKRSSNESLPTNVKPEVRQIAIPLFISYPISRELRLSLTQTGAFSEIGSKENQRLKGWDDTHIQVSYLTANRRLLLIGGLGLPTGDALSTAQAHEIANALYSDLLPFKVSRYGEGFNVGGDAMWAQHVGPFGLAIGAGYLYRGSYETWVTDRKATWNPEDEIHFKGGVNFLKRHFAWHTGVTYIRFFSDDLSEIPQLENGLIIQNQLAHTGPTFSLSLDALAVIKNAESGDDLPKTVLASSLVGEYALTRSLSLRGEVSAKHIPDKDTIEAKAWLYSFGGGTHIRLVRGIRLDVGFTVSTGHESIHQDNTSFKVDLRGFSIRSSVSSFF